jgi:hypothetical protein
MFRTLGYALTLSCFVCGPATELARAIHLAHVSPQHHSDSCPVCIQLTVGASAPVVEAPTLLALDAAPSLDSSPRPQVLVRTDERTPWTARAPPPVA